MNGLHLLAITFAVLGAAWWLTRDRGRGSRDYDVSPGALIAALPAGALLAVLAWVLGSAFLLVLSPR